MRRLFLLILLLVLVPAGVRADSASVTYVTSKTFYVDAGRSAGLIPGASVEVLREGALVATARVREVTAGRRKGR